MSKWSRVCQGQVPLTAGGTERSAPARARAGARPRAVARGALRTTTRRSHTSHTSRIIPLTRLLTRRLPDALSLSHGYRVEAEGNAR